MGRLEYEVEPFVLRKSISKWFFMSSITRRYTSSPESAMEFDLAQFRNINDTEQFVSFLNSKANSVLTGDFWSTTLPTELATSSSRSPSLFSYIASLIMMDAKALWSNLKISDFEYPDIVSNKAPIEKHHLFPFEFLKKNGYESIRDTNQIANYALLEWQDNVKISDQNPRDYVPAIEKRFSKKELEKMYYWHALPENWYLMDYPEFLLKRREMIAKVIQDGFGLISKEIELSIDEDSILPIPDLIQGGENDTIEFKSTLRVNLHTGERDVAIEHSAIKTIAGFLNTDGGQLFIGVDDSGNTVGIHSDKFENHDKMNLHLVNLVKNQLGPQNMIYLTIRFKELEDNYIMAIECKPANKEVFLKDSNNERFYIRTGASTLELTGHQMQDYIKTRF